MKRLKLKSFILSLSLLTLMSLNACQKNNEPSEQVNGHSSEQTETSASDQLGEAATPARSTIDLQKAPQVNYTRIRLDKDAIISALNLAESEYLVTGNGLQMSKTATRDVYFNGESFLLYTNDLTNVITDFYLPGIGQRTFYDELGNEDLELDFASREDIQSQSLDLIKRL